MKKICFIGTVVFLFFIACKKENTKIEIKQGDSTEVVFYDTVFNFGTIEAGADIVHKFKFKNTGDKPLVIFKVTSSCGCTVADFPLKPIAPGKSDYITVEFNSSGKVGEQYKTVKVYTNTKPGKNILLIKGFVNNPNQKIDL